MPDRSDRSDQTPAAERFAEFIRTLGRGPSRSRALSLEEAEAAMTMVCRGQVEPLQLGALLVLWRYRGETPGELAGMVRALRATVALPSPAPVVDLDWPTYAAGRTRGLPWFVLSALLLADHGVRVAMHGFNAYQRHPVTPERALAALGVPAAASPAEAGRQLERTGFAYLPLARVCPKLQELIELRRLLGVRSAANTAARLLNPLNAPAMIQGVFHPPYRDLQQQAALLLATPGLAVFKGGGGEAERLPGKSVEVFGVIAGQPERQLWPPSADDGVRPAETDPPDPAALVAQWRGTAEDPGAAAVITGTAAIALRLLGRADTPALAEALAASWWRHRRRDRWG